MGPEKWKGEVPVREAVEQDEQASREERDREGAPREATDPREDDGYAQPESSTQKAPPRPPDDS